MAKLTVQEVLEKKYLTDATLAEKLLLPEGTAGRLTLDDDIIKTHIHQVGAYIEVYGDQEERDSHDDGDSTNDIVFTLDGEEKTYTGKPTVAASTALKSLGITGTLYLDGEEFVTKGLKATDLAGLDLLTAPVLCEVTLNDDGDYDGDGSASVAAGDLALNDLVAPLREGYHVEGYYAAGTGDKVAEADGTLVADVEGYTDETGAWVYEGESVTLYAHWTADEVVEQPADPNAEPQVENPDQGAE